MNGGCCNVHRKIFAVAHFQIAPRAIFIITPDVKVGFYISESKVVPVDVFHFLNFKVIGFLRKSLFHPNCRQIKKILRFPSKTIVRETL
jgi:hypothetical protein